MGDDEGTEIRLGRSPVLPIAGLVFLALAAFLVLRRPPPVPAPAPTPIPSPSPPARLVFGRQSSDGLEVRVRADCPGGSGVCPLHVLVGATAFDVARRGEPTTPLEVLRASRSAPSFAVVTVQAPVVRVRVRFADGGSDEMVPVEGVAVLAHRSAGGYVALDALDAAGSLVASCAGAGGTPTCSSPVPR